MNRAVRWIVKALVLILIVVCPSASSHAARPAPDAAMLSDRIDPAAVERFGPAYRYPKAGWIVLHIEGEPYERGYQHGRLLGPEIAEYVKVLATSRSSKAPADAWHQNRTLANALFLRRYDKEYLEEMKGIAEGAAAAGAKFEDRAIDFLDIVALNAEIEIDLIESALAATPHGLEGRTFTEPDDSSPRHKPPSRCSAFAATGPATADGHVVFGHVTMFSLPFVSHYNVWLDVRPSRGHRVLMQSYPGGIQSGMDYYLNDAGLLVAETTIDQTRFDLNGQALGSRIRKALQYADSIDDIVTVLSASNNGMYTNEWLLADTRTDEIAMFELGTARSKLWRSSKDEWFGGTKGFYWGCNNTKDLDVRLETVASVEGRPADVVFHPSDRDRAWIGLFETHKGTIDARFGFEAFSTPPIVAFPSCDAKFTTSAMARELKTYALFGPPMGRTWEPTQDERAKHPEVKPLVPNDWTILDAEPPPSAEAETRAAADLAFSKKDKEHEKEDEEDHDRDRLPDDLPAAWHGTILPASDGDIWLASAFARYEDIVARERATHVRAKDRALHEHEKDRLELDLFAPRSTYLAAVHRNRGDIPLAEIRPELTRDAWYDIASGKGVLLLAALRSKLGDDVFLKLMDDFGRAHAGKPATTASFISAVSALSDQERAPGTAFFVNWLKDRGLPDDPRRGEGGWSIDSYEHDPGDALIVYGTLREADAQREAAGLLQRQIARHGSNVTVPIVADRDAGDDRMRDHHILLIGRPDSNAVAGRLIGGVPVTFGHRSFTIRGQNYAHPHSAVIAAGGSPLSPAREVVIHAGLSAEATRRCVLELGGRDEPPAEVLLLADDAHPRRMVVPADAPPVEAANSSGSSGGVKRSP